jgi:hypothetical protein
MRSEEIKGIVEIKVFNEFISASGLLIDPASVIKQNPPSPDILCQSSDEGPMEFELVEICDRNIASVSSKILKGKIDESIYIRTGDPSAMILSKKLGCKYATRLPVDLLCYTDGRVVTPDTIICVIARSLLSSYTGVFRRAWFLGEGGAYKIWPET